MVDRKSKDVIERMDAALGLMDKSVRELREVIIELRSGDVKIVRDEQADDE